MSTIDRYSIATLVLFLLSTCFVIKPLKFKVPVWRLGPIPLRLGLMSAPIIAICILWASGCIDGRQVRDGIIGTDNVKPYNILILFISLAYMAITLDITGILQSAAFWVSNKGGHNARKLFLYFYLLLTGISLVIGNDPVILSGTVFLVYYTAATRLDPVAWLISEFAAANTASMVLFVGNPTNVVICEGFRVNNAAFTAYTILPFIACSVACFAGLAFQFRDPKHVPKRLKDIPEFRPLEPLRDPGSAVFGTILLITCLVVIIILSFYSIDVWKIVLPFALVKFIFDLIWDHFRHKRKLKQGDADSSDDELTADQRLQKNFKRAMSTDSERPLTAVNGSAVNGFVLPSNTITTEPESTVLEEAPQTIPSRKTERKQSEFEKRFFPIVGPKLYSKHRSLAVHFPTFMTALPRLPFSLIPFAFSQFILIEGLAHRGWIELFAHWLVKASQKQMLPTIWLIGVLGVLLCNGAGTNIGATILLTKVVNAAQMPANTERAAAISLAVASNIGAVSFTFSASLAGLLWDSILKDKKVKIRQRDFAFWNMLPLLLMTVAGLLVVTAQMTVLYR